MKNKFLLISTFLFLSIQSYSQNHRISSGWGFGSTSQILDIFREIGSGFSAIAFDSDYITKTKNVGEYRLGYAYTPKNRWNFGASFSYNYSEFDIFNSEEKIGEQSNAYYTLAAETSYYYMNKERTKLYGLLGLGATFVDLEAKDYINQTSEKSTDSFPNYHFTPIGVSYGKNWGGFAEIGFGYRGLFSCGLFLNL